MTPAAQTLCRKLAEAEYPDAVIRNDVDGALWIVIEGYAPRPAPDYLTDPAETVRMLKALLESGWSIRKNRSKNHKYMYAVSDNHDGGYGNHYYHDDLLYALAEAYLAMLLAKKEHGRGGEETV